MGAGAWKVAYADFMTAMMAFFLLMWILNMTDSKTKEVLAGMFKADSQYRTNTLTPLGMSNNPLIQYPDKLPTEHNIIDETERSSLAISQAINQFLLRDAVPSANSGVTTDNIGVLFHLTPSVLFRPGTVDFTPEGTSILDDVLGLLHKYKAYLVVRGHTDSRETGQPNYANKWELAAARSNAAVRYLIAKGADPNHLLSVSYADTRPAVAQDAPNSLERNARVEFYFHRPDVMSTVVGY